MPFISAAFWLICEDAEKISWRRRGRRAKLQAGKNINEDLGLFWLVALVLRCVYGCLTCSGFGLIGRLLCGVCVSNYCTICYKTAHPPYSGRTGLLFFLVPFFVIQTQPFFASCRLELLHLIT